MPTYMFMNRNTGETVEKLLPHADMIKFLEENPELDRHYSGELPSIGDPVRLGIRRPDAEFQSLLRNIADTTPGGKGMRSWIR